MTLDFDDCKFARFEVLTQGSEPAGFMRRVERAKRPLCAVRGSVSSRRAGLIRAKGAPVGAGALMGRRDFLCEAVANPLAPLLVAGELSLLGEFPETSHSRAALEAVGSGERTFSTIAAQVGGTGALPSGTLSPLLNTLPAKRVLAAGLPLSAKADGKNKRYRIADPYLRLWDDELTTSA
ncbi:hypothetical protein ACFXPI_05710 [Streptomyces sp. NPDC059104]|uniref:hypothetical protein n=1 Tax=Streptomyces sp. NPDC059104 TaxID=3346729 RepID=UPI0036B410F8